MPRFEDGSYGSVKGIALIAKVLAGKCSMHYTRVAVGNGTIPEDMTPKTMGEPAGYIMDGMIVSVANPIDGECQVTVQVNSAQVERGFYATGLVLYASDPDEGEVPYTYLVLENEPEWIRPSGSIVGKLATFDIIAAVGDVDAVTAIIDPNSITTAAAVQQMIEDHNCDPEAHPGLLGRMRGIEVALNGSETISGDGSPTVETKGMKGQHYINSITGEEFVCTDATEDGYIWEPYENAEAFGGLLAAKQDALSPDESIVLEGKEIRVALPVKAVTEEEYDGLSEAEKAADVAYLVTDDAPDSPEPPWNRRNLLDNWYFADPLNQRGQTKYTGIGYTIDRWYFGNEKSSAAPTIELLDDCIFIQTNTSDAQYHYFIQRMELDTYRQYRGKTITVSLLAKGAGTLMLYGGYLRADDTYVQKFSMRALSDDYDVYTLTYAIPDDLPNDIKCAELGNFQLANGAGSIYAKAMKVELGDRQTLAHQDAEGNWVLNDPPPNKAAELAKCQRCMYNPLYGASGHYNRLGTGFAIGSKMVLISIPLPTSMRITPAVNWSNLILRDLSNYTSIVGIRSITTDSNSIGAGSVTLLCETINTIASGRSFVLETVHDDALTGTMLLDANL